MEAPIGNRKEVAEARELPVSVIAALSAVDSTFADIPTDIGNNYVAVIPPLSLSGGDRNRHCRKANRPCDHKRKDSH
jgi:hypothetical protein